MPHSVYNNFFSERKKRVTETAVFIVVLIMERETTNFMRKSETEQKRFFRPSDEN